MLEGIAERRFGKSDIEQVLAYFGPSCVYCGAKTFERWDHLFPISKGGDTVLGNIVPACRKCDDSKRDLPYDEWVRGSAPGSPSSLGIADLEDRLDKINEYVSRYNYHPRMPVERLNTEELRQFELIQEDLSKLRKDIDGFIAMYRERTGLR